MVLLEAFLFLGIPLDSDLQKELDQIDPSLLALFLKEDDEEYLSLKEIDKIKYLGKKVDKIIDMKKLVMVEKHLNSLLSKILPDRAWPSFTLIASNV